jgi:hypothetical protein
MKVLPVLIVCCLIPLLYSQNKETPSAAGQNSLTNAVIAIVTNLVALERKVAALKADLEDHNLRSELEKEHNKLVVLDPTDNVLQPVESGPLFFLVGCQSLTPSVVGYRLKLGVVNPWAMRINGARFHVRWGPLLTPINAGGKRHLKTGYAGTLRPGTLEEVTIILDPFSPEDAKTLTLSVEHEALELSRR